MNTTESLVKLCLKAQEAYAAIPKQPFIRTIDEKRQIITLSCPNCGVIFAQYSWGWTYSFDTPIFCCGKMMI